MTDDMEIRCNPEGGRRPPSGISFERLGRIASRVLASLTLSEKPPVIAYLFTTFPHSTETFLQREIIAMKSLGAHLRLYSLWGGLGCWFKRSTRSR